MPRGARGRLFTSHGPYSTSQEMDLSMTDLQEKAPDPARGTAAGSVPETAPDSPGTVREMKTAAASVFPAGNTATGTLKLIALAFMLIDHLGAVVFTRYPEMRIIGRVAFPIYCWCMVVGFHYTRSVPKYLARVAVTGLLAQPLYAWVMNHVGTSGNVIRDYFLYRPNIFLTLLLGLAALWGIREKKLFSQFWAPAAALLLATDLHVDYGWRGVALILLLYAARGSRPAIAAVMTAFFLYWGTMYSLTSSLFGIPVHLDTVPVAVGNILTALLRMETYGLASLAFILPRYGKNIRLPAWVSYGIYPAHLLIVLLFKLLVR